MLNGSRVALFAALSLGMTALFSGFVPVAALDAAQRADDQAGFLLPQSVVAAAEAEARQPVNYAIVPDSSDEAPAAPKRRAASLATLVADNWSSVTANREEECLAAAIYFEARSESLEGQLAVARVIINRTQSGRFPGSVCGVVFQPGQFSFVRGSGFPPIARASRDWQDAVAIARIADQDLWSSGAPRALFFHASRVSPGWRLTRVAEIGNHVFYR